MTGSFQVTSTLDDDYLGFVFGYQSPDTVWGPATAINNADMDFYLFDWKQNQQTYLGYFAQEGFTINDVDGIYQYNVASVFPGFWSHINSAAFNVLATDYGVTRGWLDLTVYDFELLYTPTRALVKIDNDTIFDLNGCFEPGLFGFYNYSQDNANYWNFNYELYVDFQMQAQYVCVGDSARFSFVDTGNCNTANAFSNIASFYWDFGDGNVSYDTNAAHVYTSVDSFTVLLVATDLNGCTDTNSKQIYIQGPVDPEIGFSSACLGDSIYFQDLTVPAVGSIVGWQWDFGDGSPTSALEQPAHYYSASGNYTVQMIVQNNAGCMDTTDTVIQVLSPPTPDFGFLSACDGNANTLFDQSISSGPALVDYFWDIDNDGTVDYSGNDSSMHVFSGYGTYPVELKVLDAAGCRDSIVLNVTVDPLPIVGFDVTSVCFKDSNAFNDTSSVPLGSISDLVWSFGDGDSAFNVSSPSHRYDSVGTKVVTLIATTDKGCVGTTSANVQVYKLPFASFSTDSVCLDQSAVYTSSSTANFGTLVSYLWDFGDGDSAYTSMPTHLYSAPGLYEVNHTVVSNKGCRDTTSRNIRIYPLPTTTFSWTNNVCEGDELKLTEQSFVQQVTPYGDTIVNWEWIVDDQDTLYGRNPQITANTYRTLKVFLTATTNFGCIATYENFPQVFPLPVAQMTQDVNCEDYSSDFASASTVPTGLVSDWQWTFGDGGSASGESVKHVYNSPGYYEVELRVTTNKGCTDTMLKQVVVPGTPVIDFDFTPELGCAPLEISFTNNSSVLVGDLIYRWYVGGKEFSGLENPTLTLTTDSLEPQLFSVKLTAISEDDCYRSKTLTDAITVVPSPDAKFFLSAEDLNMFEPLATFYNNSFNSIRWDWDFGDGSESSDFAPQHVYSKSGAYDVELVAYNQYNCTDSMIKRIEVDPRTTLYIPNTFTPNGDGHNEIWAPKGFNEGQPFELIIWDRWGHKLFQSSFLGQGWDGKVKGGGFAQNGSYLYQITMETPEGEYLEYKGTFSLLR